MQLCQPINEIFFAKLSQLYGWRESVMFLYFKTLRARTKSLTKAAIPNPRVQPQLKTKTTK